MMYGLQLAANILNITALMFAAESIVYAACVSVALSLTFNLISIYKAMKCII